MKQIKIRAIAVLLVLGLGVSTTVMAGKVGMLLAKTTETTEKAEHHTNQAAQKTPASVESVNRDVREMLKDAVVHVYVVKHTYSTLSPWNSHTRSGSGSGFIIDDNMILTNAHVAADATFLEVQRHGETKRYEAEVVFISHESDLALIRPKDADIFKDVKPLELGKLPETQQDVEVYGFPIGGTTLSVTRGVVSRIEKQNYAHTSENLIAVQVDAAINFGNSGGPVISEDKVVGVAMQSGFFTENIGYMIPTPIIRHFLKDFADGEQDGFGFPGFLVQSLENPAMRRKYNLDEEQSGILIHKIYPNSPAEGKMQVGDIVTQIDGNSIENNGTIEFRSGEYIDYTHYIDLHQLGEEIKFKVFRDKQELDIALTLDKPGKDYLLIKPNQYDKQPTFFIFGGFVFMPLNQDVLDTMDPVPPSLAALAQEAPTDDRQEVVIMTRVLPADINKDHHHDNGLLIEKVNGERFVDFVSFYEKLQATEGQFVILEADDGYQVVIDRQEAEEKQPAILARYGINADRSKDLQKRDKTEQQRLADSEVEAEAESKQDNADAPPSAETADSNEDSDV